MNKIKSVSLFFRVVFQGLFVLIPLVFAIGWSIAPDPLISPGHIFSMNVIPREYNGRIFHVLTSSEKFLGFIFNCIPMAVYLFILYSLIKLFRLYEQGEIFSLKNVKNIRNVGYGLLIGQLIYPFYSVIMGLVLTLGNPKGQHLRYIAITLDQTNIGILLTGLLVILISWIMAEGCKLQEEQQLTI